MRAWHHCMAETHNRPLCDAGALWELKMLAAFFIVLAILCCALKLYERQ